MGDALAIDTTRYTRDELTRAIRRTQGDPSVDAFHKLWYECGHTWAMTRYHGIPILKNPNDLQIYQDILWQVRPRVVIETGTAFGASALWFAHQLELIHKDQNSTVVTIDVEDRRHAYTDGAVGDGWSGPAEHPSIRWLRGSSVDGELVAKAAIYVSRHGDRASVMVSLDSDHSTAHVQQELELYAPLVTPGSYLVVEDTNIGGHPVALESGAGPMLAVQQFLRESEAFVSDTICERYLVTASPLGWIRRVSE